MFQKELQVRKASEKQAMLAFLRNEMLEKRNALIRQAVRATPELLEHAAAKITSSFIRERLMEYDSVKDAYGAGGSVTGDINSILAEAFCADLIAPVPCGIRSGAGRALIAISGQRSAVRKIDHKLTVYGTEDNCQKRDLQDLWDLQDWELGVGNRSSLLQERAFCIHFRDFAL